MRPVIVRSACSALVSNVRASLQTKTTTGRAPSVLKRGAIAIRETPDVVTLIELWGDRPVGSIGEGDVEEYRETLMERGLAASTLNQHRAVVRGIFALAVARHGAPTNPGLAFEWAKSRRGKSDAISFYRPDEVQALARAAADAQDAAVYVVAAFTGLRLSELRALRWRSVDHDDSLVHIERATPTTAGRTCRSPTACAPCR
jgi:integrase